MFNLAAPKPRPKKRARRARQLGGRPHKNTTNANLRKRFYCARNAVIGWHNLNVITQKRGFTSDALWLAHHLWGRYYKDKLYHKGRVWKKWFEEWLGAPENRASLINLLLALEHLLTLPRSLVEADRDDYWERILPGRRRRR